MDIINGSPFRSEGKLLENNWEVHPNGQGYQGRFEGQRSDLYNRLVDKYDQKAEKVRQKYAAQYGLGEAEQQATTTKVKPLGSTTEPKSKKTKRSNARPIRASKKKENN